MKLTLKTLLLAASLATAAQAETIHIQPKAALPANQDVHLADIATITDATPQIAEALASTVILNNLNAAHTLKTESILMAIISQHGPAVSSHLQVAGSSLCEITLGTPSATGTYQSQPQSTDDSRLMAMTPTRLDAPVVPAIVAPQPKSVPVLTATSVPLDAPDTLSKMITAKIAQELQTTPDDLRITFDTINPLLDEPLAAGKSWRFRTLSHPLLGSVQFDATLLDGTHTIKKLLIAAHVEKHVQVLVATTDITRGDLLSKTQFALQDTYIDRIIPSIFSKDTDVIGLEAQREVAAGSMLDKRDFKAAQLVSRNDQVTIICIAGSLRVQVAGRSSDNGKLHDTISVKNEKTGEIYSATIIGKRLAIVGDAIDEAQEKQLRESH